jgi:hypothetical protein
MMHWRDIHSDGPDRAFLGLELTIEPRVRPALHVQAGRPYLMRLMAGSSPLLWARVDHDQYGFWYVRRRPALGSSGLVTPPLTALEARAPSEPMGSEAWYRVWARFFARKLEASAASPLGAGRWRLVPATPHAGRADPRHPPPRGPALAPVCHLEKVAEQDDHDYADWDTGHDQSPLALRSLSSVEDDRVKAWRRGCRERALPPVLLMWVSGLVRYVILDGHDRLLAALAEGEPPPVLALLRLQEERVERDAGEARSVAAQVSAHLLGTPDPGPRSHGPRVEFANRLLIDAYDDGPNLSAVTQAWPLAGGVSAWCAEVRRALEGGGESAEGVREAMVDGLETAP